MNDNTNILITVFTPAFNRATTLVRTYNSLLNQDCKDFIWLIVDDGSTDNTRELVNEWQNNENGFDIRYIYKENGGMHTAHNVAYENISTELNMCIDSDDELAQGAMSLILKKWDEVKDLGYAGIVALDADLNNGNVIGTKFPEGILDSTLTGFYASGGKGDKKLIYRTEVINKYPQYPVFDNEKYVPLSYKYRLIDQEYKLAVLNEVVCNVEYLDNGSSRNMYRQYVNNPQGFAFWRKISMTYPQSFKRLIFDCIHYVSSSFLSSNRKFIKESPRKFLTVLCIPFGLILTFIIKGKANAK